MGISLHKEERGYVDSHDTGVGYVDDSLLNRELWITFLTEMGTRTSGISRDLLTLESEPSAEQRIEVLDRLLRSAHSLKGAAGLVRQEVIEAACHGVESMLAPVRDGRSELRPAALELMFAVVDALHDARARLLAGRGLEGSALAELCTYLDAAADPARSPVRPSEPEEPPLFVEPSSPGPAALLLGGGASSSCSVLVPARTVDALLASCEAIEDVRRRAAIRAEELSVIREIAGLSGPDAPEPDPGERLRLLRQEIERFSERLQADKIHLERVSVQMEDGVRRIRCLSFSEACDGLGRAARDLARRTGKEVDLVIEGADVEIERSVLDALRDPLLHLVRNAIDHGIELPAEREAQGKPRRGRVTVSAALHGAAVEIAVHDDGRGLDVCAIRQRAREQGIDEPLDADALARTILLPRFSTAREVTTVSGRGMGLDIARSAALARSGSVSIAFEEGRGTRVVLLVPLAQSARTVLLVACAGQTFALDDVHVEKLLFVRERDVREVGGRPVVIVDQQPLPVARLARLLSPRVNDVNDVNDVDGAPARGSSLWESGVLIAAGGARAVLLVDELLERCDAIVKDLGARIRGSRLVSGAAILPDGRVALVLRTKSLVAR